MACCQGLDWTGIDQTLKHHPACALDASSRAAARRVEPSLATQEIVMDGCGSLLTQRLLNRIVAEATRTSDAKYVTITIRNVSRDGFPVLLAYHPGLLDDSVVSEAIK